jgi:hypothetical protein
VENDRGSARIEVTRVTVMPLSPRHAKRIGAVSFTELLLLSFLGQHAWLKPLLPA